MAYFWSIWFSKFKFQRRFYLLMQVCYIVVGHSMVYDVDGQNLWIFGGYSLTSVTNQLKRFNLTSSRWEL